MTSILTLDDIRRDGWQSAIDRVVCADCREMMKLIPDKSVQLCLQDPPYNLIQCSWDYDIMPEIPDYWTQWKRIAKPNAAIVFTASQPFTSKLVMSNLKMFKYEWIWEKDLATGFLNANNKPMQIHEHIVVFYDHLPIYNPIKRKGTPYKCENKPNRGSITGDPKIQKGGWVTINKGDRFPISILKINTEREDHPTQKPVALMEYLILTYTNEGDLVYDGFSGVFTTALACKKLHRHFICVEREMKYCEIGVERLRQGVLPLTINERKI